MPTLDEFGGVAVEEPSKSSTDEFGGVSIDEVAPPIPEINRFPSSATIKAPSPPLLPAMGERSTTYGGPTVRVPEGEMGQTVRDIGEGVGESLTHPGIPFSQLVPEDKPDDHPAVSVGKHAARLALGIPEFLTSAAGAETMLAGAAAPAVVSGAFTADMLYNLWKQIKETIPSWDKMTTAQKAGALTDMGGTAVMALLTGAHATTGALNRLVPARRVADLLNKSEFTPEPKPGFGLVQPGQPSPAPPMVTDKDLPPIGERDLSPQAQIDAGIREGPITPPTPETPPAAPAAPVVAPSVEAAKPEATAAAVAVEESIKPALKFGKSVLEGGKNHNEVRDNNIDKVGDPVDLITESAKNENHVFIHTKPDGTTEILDRAAAGPVYDRLWGNEPETTKSLESEMLEQPKKQKAAASESVKGGAESGLSPEARAISRANNSLRKMAEANGVEFVEGDTPKTILAKINAKASQPVAPPAPPAADLGAPASSVGLSAPVDLNQPARTKKPYSGLQYAGAPEPKPAPPVEGMPTSQDLGAAVPSAFDNPESFVSNMFTAIDRDRVAMGKPPMERGPHHTWSEANQKAEAMMNKDPNWIPNLIQSVLKKPRSIEPFENAGQLWYKAKLKAEYNNALQRGNRAFEDGRTEDLAAAQTDASVFEDQIDLMDKAFGRGGAGTQAGLSLQAQKMGLTDDFTLVEMTLQKRAAMGGRRLTPDETSAIQKDVDRLNALNAALQKNLSEAESKTQEANVKLALETIEKDNLRKQIPDFSPKVLDLARKWVDKWDREATESMGKLLGKTWAPTPEMLLDLAKVARGNIAHVGLGFAEWSVKMTDKLGKGVEQFLQGAWDRAHKMIEEDAGISEPVKRAIKKNATASEKQTDIVERIKAKLEGKRLDEITPLVQKLARQFSDQGVRGWRAMGDAVHGVLKELIPDLDYRDTLDAVSGHGKFKIPNQEEGAKALRDAKSQMQEVRKIQEVIARQPVQPTGLKRDLPSDIKRRLTQIYENAKRKYGIVISDPETQLRSALQARKTYYEHRISDLQAEINSRKRVIKTKAPSPTDPALEKLVAEYKLVKAAHDEAFGPRELTDDQRAERESKSLDRQIAEVQRQLKEGDIFPGGKTARPTSPEIEARRANLEALKSERDYLRESINPKTTPEQQELAATENRRDQLQKSIDEAERKINTGDIDAKKAERAPESTSELQAMRDDLDSLNQMVAKLRAAVRPELTDAQRLASIKASLTRNNAKLLDRIARGDFAKRPRREVVMDSEATRLRAESERIKKRWREALQADRMKNRTPWEKALDWGTKYRRFTALSSPVVLPKLLGAAGWRAIATLAEDVSGRALSFVPGVRQISQRAPLEGYGGQLSATMRGFGSAFTQGMVDAAKVAKTGHSDIDVLYGKANESYTGESEMASLILNIPGRSHGVIKAPVKRGAFEKATQRLGEYYARQGLDVTSEPVKLRIAMEAYKAGNRAIFLQDNRVASGFNSALAALERKGETGHPAPGGKVLSTAARFMFPVTRVPTNIAAETLQYSTGSVTGSVRAINAIRKGLDTLTPDQADLIMRELKKGAVGMALLFLGYMGYQQVGGVYEQGQKRKKGDVKPDAARIFGVDIAGNLLHHPAINTIQLGATVHRVADEKLRKKDPDAQGLSAGVLAASWGLADEVPFIQGPHRLFRGMADPRTREKTVGSEVGSIAIPQAVAWIAQVLDQRRETPPSNLYQRVTGAPAKLKPQGVLQTIETRIPGLRKNVPPAPVAK